MASYPSTIVTLATHNDVTDTIFAADINTPNAEIVAIETGLLNGFQHSLVPLTDDTYSLGNTSKRWLKAWLQDLDADGSFTLGASTAHGVLIGEAGSPVVSTSVGATGTILAGNTGADPTFQTSSGVGASLVLLKAGNGTDTSAGATVVDSIAISGLTIKDIVRVTISILSVTQNTAQVFLYDVTDSQNLASVSPSPLPSSSSVMGESLIGPQPATPTTYSVVFQGMSNTSTRYDNYVNASGLTAWTTGFTLGLRHGGVVSGGTFKWQWAVYLQKGE